MNKFICAAIVIVLALSMMSYAQAAVKDRDHEINAAITKLEKAKQDLSTKKSGDEYGGHREEAIKHLDAALGELHQALEFAHAHPQDEKHHG